MTVTRSPETAGSDSKLESKNPATGDVIGAVPVHAADDVEAALARSHEAFETWGSLGFDGRREQLLSWRRELVNRIDDLAELIHRENGKPVIDSYREIFVAVQHLSFASKRAKRVLRTRKTSPGLLTNFRATVGYFPFGVVGVIGPWNYPVFTPMGSIAYALAAGNTVVFKPSELTPLIGRALAEAADAAIDVPDVFQVVTGEGATGAALASSPNVDKLAFTGSAATGKRVMAAAAENLTPVVMELGGKDALIVAADADVERAAEAAVYGALENCGQACVSIERAYVVDSVYDAFVDKAVGAAKRVVLPGTDDEQIGPMTDTRQVEKVRDQLEDAAQKGASFLLGGPDTVKDGNVITPSVVTDVSDEMLLMKDETFGPVLPIIRVSDAEAAIAEANATPFGLGSSVWGRAGVRQLADRIKAGMTSINSVIAFGGISSLPFGGVGESGFGRIHGDDGLREFTRPKATAEEKYASPMNLIAFADDPKSITKLVKTLAKQLYGSGAVDKADEVISKFRP